MENWQIKFLKLNLLIEDTTIKQDRESHYSLSWGITGFRQSKLENTCLY